MKIFFSNIIFILAAGFFFPVLSQDSIHVELSFQMKDFKMVSDGNGLVRILAEKDTYFYSEEPNQAAIPYRSIDVLIPAGAELISFDFSFEKEDYPEVIEVSKNEIPVSYNNVTLLQANDSSSPFTGDFPQQVLRYNDQQIMQGYQWINFTVSPFLFDGQKGILSLIKHLDIHIVYHQKTGHTGFSRKDKDIVKTVSERVENAEDLERFYLNSDRTLLKSSQLPVDYLIITTEALKAGFQELIDWKIRKGLKAEIITLDEIFDRYEDPTPQLKIKRCIQENYEERNLKWVLLGGDEGQVPVQGCFGVVDVDLVDNTIPADLFYACFDKSFDWNGNVNEKIGEPYIDFVDIFPEVYISRAPVNNLEEVQVFVRKTLDYELFTPHSNFAEKILLAGVKSWNIWDGKSDNHHRNEKMYHDYVESEWSGSKYGYYDTGSDFPGGEKYQLTASGLSEQINSGYNIFHFAGHGNSNSILMEQGTGFSVKEAFTLENKASGVILSSSCFINSFDKADPCLSEGLLRNPSGGCVAFWGSARDAWGLPDKSPNLGPSFRFNAKFMESLFKEGQPDISYTFGALCSSAKTKLTGNGTIAGAYWFLQYAINAMGDPELPIYSQNPSEFDNVRIYQWDNHLTVNTGGIKNCRICVTSEALDLGYQEIAEGVSYFTFDDVPESYQVTITKRNFIPYRYHSTLTSDKNAEHIGFSNIYPNPAMHMVNIDFNCKKGTLYVHDMHGNTQKVNEISFGSNAIDLSGLNEGIYILNIVTEQGTERKKLIKR